MYDRSEARTHDPEDNLVNLTRAYAHSIVPYTASELEMPYEARAIVHAGMSVLVGDKSGALGAFDWLCRPLAPLVRLASSSIDAIALLPRRRQRAAGEATLTAAVGTRDGELLLVEVDVHSKAGGRPIAHRTVCRFSAAITCLLYVPDETCLVVATEDGILTSVSLPNEMTTVEVLSRVAISPFPQQLRVVSAHDSGGEPESSVFAATKLGMIFRFRAKELTRKPLDSKELIPWHIVDDTVNCILPVSLGVLPSRPGRTHLPPVGLAVGTNRGILWLEQAHRETQRVLLAELDHSSRVTALEMLRLPETLATLEGMQSHWLIANYPSGGLKIYAIPEMGVDRPEFLARLLRPPVLEVETSPGVFAMAARVGRPLHDTALPRRAIQGVIALGSPDHRLQTLAIRRPSYLKSELIGQLRQRDEHPLALIDRILDAHPSDWKLRAGVVRLVLDIAEGTACFPDVTPTSPALHELLLRCIRGANKPLQDALVVRLAQLARQPQRGEIGCLYARLSEFVEKYVVSGQTFSSKRLCLRSLAAFNARQSRSGTYHRNALDAAIYYSLLAATQGLDLVQITPLNSLVWSVVAFEADGKRYVAFSEDSGALHVARVAPTGDIQGLRLCEVREWLGPAGAELRSNYARALLVVNDGLLAALCDGRLVKFALCEVLETSGPLHPVDVPLGVATQHGPIYSLAADPRRPTGVFLGTRAGSVWSLDVETGVLTLMMPPGGGSGQAAYGDVTEQGGRQRSHLLDRRATHSPIWQLEAETRPDHNLRLWAASGDGRLRVASLNEQSGRVREGSFRLVSHPNCFARLPSDRQAEPSTPTEIVVGDEGGGVTALRVGDDGTELRFMPLWAHHPSSQPVRDTVVLDPPGTADIVVVSLDGKGYRFSRDGELKSELSLGMPANCALHLGAAPDSTEEMPIETLLVGGESGGDSVRLFELSDAAAWEKLLTKQLESMEMVEPSRGLLLRKAAAVDITPNRMLERMLRHRYMEVPASSDKSGPDAARQFDRLEVRISALLLRGYDPTAEQALLALLAMLFERLGGEELSENFERQATAMAILDMAADRWGTFASPANDRIRLHCFSNLLRGMTAPLLLSLTSKDMREHLRHKQLHSLPYVLSSLLRHPAQHVRYGALEAVEGMLATIHPIPAGVTTRECFQWIVEEVTGVLPLEREAVEELTWVDLRACRVFLALARTSHMQPAYVMYLLTRGRTSAAVLLYLSLLTTDDSLRRGLQMVAELCDSLEPGSSQGLRNAVGQVARFAEEQETGSTPSDYASSGFDQAFSLLYKMLNAMLVPHPDGISPELLERASALLSTREPHFPLSLDRIDDVRRASQYVREYAALSGDARSAAASRCVHNLRILLDKFPRAAGIGCIRKTMAAAIAGWLRWVEMDMEVWNPIALLEDFRKTLAGGTNQRDAYERARIQLLQRLHWALGAEESRLYVFTEDAETSTVVMGSDALPLTSRGTADVRAVRRFVEEQTSDEHPDAGGHPLLGSGVRSGDFAVQTMPLYRAGFLDHAYVFLLKRTRDDPEKMIHPLRFLPLLLEADFLVAQRLTMQSAMVRAAAHQLRTPLHTLRGYMSALFGGHVKASAVVERYRATLEATGEYLSRIVEGIVVSERLSREALPLRKADYDLAEDAAACAQMMRYVWRRNDQELQVILPKDPLIVHADRDRIRDVLVVLLDNACKYSPAASPVVLTFESTKRIAVLIVEDHGLGIPAEEISHIFELGYIGPTARQLNYDGSGLGLFIARSYVEAHGGVIGARSAGRRGMGTAFTVKLPRPASIPRRKG